MKIIHLTKTRDTIEADHISGLIHDQSENRSFYREHSQAVPPVVSLNSVLVMIMPGQYPVTAANSKKLGGK